MSEGVVSGVVRTAVVSGGSSGIGLAIRRRLVAEGYTVLSIGRRRCLEESDETATWISADLRTDEGRKTAGAALAKLDGIDLLVNNAGMFAGGVLAEDRENRDVFELNLWAAVALIRQALPGLLRRQGNVVNVTSLNAAKVQATAGSYSVSKAALEAATMCLALELAPSGIRVNAVAPGPVPTRLLVNAMEGNDPVAMLPFIPLGRLGNVDDVAAAVVFLGSRDAAWITGQTLRVDGGMSIA